MGVSTASAGATSVGYLCHVDGIGEYNIPVSMSAGGIGSFYKTGQTVEFDGGRGRGIFHVPAALSDAVPAKHRGTAFFRTRVNKSVWQRTDDLMVMAEHPDMTKIRTGQAPAALTREQFKERFLVRFYDPGFDGESDAIARLEAIAWDALQGGRKAPRTRPAGDGFVDPSYEVSVQWLDTRNRLEAAQRHWSDSASPSRVLLVCGSARNDGTCPGEVSKTWRLTEIARHVVEHAGLQADILDLSLVTSEYGRNIHPCKGCVSTAMPLCHWPCSCYPNHALNQADDWMAEIYERWVAAHAVIILAPTYWYQSPTPLKLMIDRMVSADGGNPDPTSTHGKHVAEAKHIEQQGWDYPKHLAGRAYGVVVHGDVAGVESHRRNLTDWLDWMGLIEAGAGAKLDRYIGYYEPYYNSHDALDKDEAVQEETRNVARAVIASVKDLRAGHLSQPDKRLKWPRTK